MKKKYLIIGFLVIFAAALSIWFLTRPKILGNINHAYSEPETSTSNISFTGETEERIKLSFASNIENGNLDIKIYDSEGNIVKELDKAEKLETFLTLEQTDTYTLEAEYKDFIGNFKITVYQSH